MKYLKLFEEHNMRDIIITLPAKIKWEDYEQELAAVANREQVMNFKVPNLPTQTQIGQRCYVCHQGQIKGWMEIVGLNSQDFTCTTTGQEWAGNFIQRSGPFHYINPIPYKGFQGFRYTNF